MTKEGDRDTNIWGEVKLERDRKKERRGREKEGEGQNQQEFESKILWKEQNKARDVASQLSLTERVWILEGDRHMKAILLNKKVGREKRRDESIKVGKAGEVRETEIRKKERFT